MSGYIDLNRTGFAEFDDVLTAIEDAGDAYHHTSQWQENDCGEPSHIERINAKINEAREALHSDGLIQVFRAEYEALKRDAKRWRAFNQRMARRLSPTNTAWKLVEVCPMYGEEKEIRDWGEQIEAAINMPANGEGGE